MLGSLLPLAPVACSRSLIPVLCPSFLAQALAVALLSQQSLWILQRLSNHAMRCINNSWGNEGESCRENERVNVFCRFSRRHEHKNLLICRLLLLLLLLDLNSLLPSLLRLFLPTSSSLFVPRASLCHPRAPPAPCLMLADAPNRLSHAWSPPHHHNHRHPGPDLLCTRELERRWGARETRAERHGHGMRCS